LAPALSTDVPVMQVVPRYTRTNPPGQVGGFEFRSRCEFDARNRKKAIPGSLKNPSLPHPLRVRGDPLPRVEQWPAALAPFTRPTIQRGVRKTLGK
jgi:hypothetical protein